MFTTVGDAELLLGAAGTKQVEIYRVPPAAPSNSGLPGRTGQTSQGSCSIVRKPISATQICKIL